MTLSKNTLVWIPTCKAALFKTCPIDSTLFTHNWWGRPLTAIGYSFQSRCVGAEPRQWKSNQSQYWTGLCSVQTFCFRAEKMSPFMVRFDWDKAVFHLLFVTGCAMGKLHIGRAATASVLHLCLHRVRPGRLREHKLEAQEKKRRAFTIQLFTSYLTCFPWIRARRQRLTMFHEVLFSYRIRFSAMATCEWQLSQQRLCFGEKKTELKLIYTYVVFI